MAVELIDLGRIANDGTGDSLRDAFLKVNQNFEELDLRQPESTTASNRGTVGEGVFAEKINADLQFKKLVPGNNVSLASTDNVITLNAVGGLQSLIVSSDSGSKILQDGDTLNVYGGTGIVTSLLGNTLTITNNGILELSEDSSPELSSDLEANNNDIKNVGVINAQNFQGPLDGLVYGIDIRDINAAINEFDFGEITQETTSAIEFIIYTVDVDFGTFTDPTEVESDFGTI